MGAGLGKDSTIRTFAGIRLPLGGLGALALVAIVVFAASGIGIILLQHAGGVAPIWIADAFIVYFVLRRPQQETARIVAAGLAARFAAGLAFGSPPLNAAVYTLCNLSEILIVAVPLRRLIATRHFSRPKGLLWFYALAGGPAPVSAALPAALFNHLALRQDFLPVALNWYAADALGLVVIVPILFTVRATRLLRMFRGDQIARTLLHLSTVFAAIAVNFIAHDHPVAFLFFPAVLFLTFQRSFEGGAIGLMLVSAYLISPIFLGRPLAGLHDQSLRDQILIVELFVAVIGFSVVLVGTALEERDRLEASLSKATRRAESSREEAMVAKETAEKANRMKSMFLATMSHELRTPLNAVIGFSQLMENETFGPLGDAHYKEYTGLIQRAGCHLLDLINDILDMSKVEAGKLELHRERIDMAGLIQECVGLMQERAHQGGVALGTELSPGLVSIDADRRAVKQILLNLLSNAVKFTPHGGQVTARASESGGRVTLAIADTGVGIPADQIYRLGNPFVQLRNSAGAAQEGTGLGLALVRSLAELHGGTLRIESAEGQGTTVTVELPAERPESLAA